MVNLSMFVLLVLPFSNALLPPCNFNKVTVRPVTPPVVLGDNPHWDPRQQVLYYVDTFGQTVNRYDPVADTFSSVYIDGGLLSVVIPTESDHQFIATRGREVVAFSWDGFSKRGPLSILATVDEDRPTNRLNDGKADELGRMWIGTNSLTKKMTTIPNQGRLYSFNENYEPKSNVGGITISNGIGWSNDNTVMYFGDSHIKKIFAFDYYIQTGELGVGRTAFDLEQNNVTGRPNGFTVDENDKIWLAVSNGSGIIQVDPSNGALLRTVPIPVKQVINCAFGGPDLNTLYVTSGRINLEPGESRLSGATFAVDGLGVRRQRKRNTAVAPFHNYETQSGCEEDLVLVDPLYAVGGRRY